MLELELPWPPSINEYWRAVPNRVAGGKIVGARNILSEPGRQYRIDVVNALSLLKLEPLTGRIGLAMELCEPELNRIRDLDNYNKGVWDALTHAKVWGDDSQIDHYIVSRGPSSGSGKVRICIQELRK